MILLAALWLSIAAPLLVVNDTGAPIANVAIVFVDASGHRDAARTDNSGRAAPAEGFVPVFADLSAAGYAPLHIDASAGRRVVMVERLPLIGSVRVATGSPRSLHQLPVASSVLDRATIRANPAATTDALLRLLPGFDRTRSNSAFTNYGQLRVSFNGAGNDRGVVLIDGFPAQDGFGGQIDWAALPPSQLERAELLRGAGSSLYGSGAIGGTLALRSVAPLLGLRGTGGTFAVEGGTHADESQSMSLFAGLGAQTGMWLGATARRMAYADLPPSFSSPVDHIASSAAQTLALRLRTAGAHSSVDVGARQAWDYQDEGRSNYDQARSFRQYDARYTFDSAAGSGTLGFYTRSTRIYNAADQYPAKPGVLRYWQLIPTVENGFDAAWSHAGAGGDFQVRADTRWVHGSTQQFGIGGVPQSSVGGSQQSSGLALQETLRGARYEFVAGIRGDAIAYANATQRALSPRVAIRVDASPSLSFRASLAGAFRAPYLNELIRGFVIGAVQYEPNPALVPERSRTAAVGFDIAMPNAHGALDLNDTLVNNAIAFVTIDAKHQRRSNIAQTRTQGATATYSHRIGECGTLGLSTTSQFPRVTAGPIADLGKRLAYVPQFSASLSAQWRQGSTTSQVTASYLGQTFADDLNTQPLGTALVIDAAIRRTLRNGVTLSVGAENATSQRYLSSNDRYAPPMLLHAGISFPLGIPQPETPCG